MWCRPEEIGQDATLGTVHAVDDVMESLGLTLYGGSQTFLVRPLVAHRYPGGKMLMYAAKNMLEITQVRAFEDYDGDGEIIDATLHGRIAIIADEGFYTQLEVTAVLGLASLEDLDSNWEPQTGDSVLRNEDVLIIDKVADYTFQAGDKLIRPPDALRMAGITIGRRIFAVIQDEEANWDAIKFVASLPNRFTDGLHEILRNYIP